jgi:ethanolamine ammonia-lyase small subunit
VLELAEAHALARDAVDGALATEELAAAIRGCGLRAQVAQSAVRSRAEYLRRPDLGRRLSEHSLSSLRRIDGSCAEGVVSTRLAVVIVDGLSALAVERHALPVLKELQSLLAHDPDDSAWELLPVVVVEQGRVAVGDAVAAALGADLVVVLIGERPGLSSPDSLGAYVTWNPTERSQDAERNCVSNIRTEGLGYGAASARIAWYCRAARRAGCTGVALLAATGHPLTWGGE